MPSLFNLWSRREQKDRCDVKWPTGWGTGLRHGEIERPVIIAISGRMILPVSRVSRWLKEVTGVTEPVGRLPSNPCNDNRDVIETSGA